MGVSTCLVTVRAGHVDPRDYEVFTGKEGLQNGVLQDVTSNLQEDLRDSAVKTFLQSVKEGLTMRECITVVQDSALALVPCERNKFFIKFVYDNQLEVEIGVNKFKNGNSQFYHKLGLHNPDSKSTCPLPVWQPCGCKDDEKTKRKATMKELLEAVPAKALRKQVTNDRSAPVISGDPWSPVAAPPLATNLQARRSLATWDTDTPRPGRQARSRSLGRPTRAGSVSRPLRPVPRESSASPLLARPARGLGDCFRTGHHPSQERLKHRGEVSWARRRGETGTFSLEREKDNGPSSGFAWAGKHHVFAKVKLNGQEDNDTTLPKKLENNNAVKIVFNSTRSDSPCNEHPLAKRTNNTAHEKEIEIGARREDEEQEEVIPWQKLPWMPNGGEFTEEGMKKVNHNVETRTVDKKRPEFRPTDVYKLISDQKPKDEPDICEDTLNTTRTTLDQIASELNENLGENEINITIHKTSQDKTNVGSINEAFEILQEEIYTSKTEMHDDLDVDAAYDKLYKTYVHSSKDLNETKTKSCDSAEAIAKTWFTAKVEAKHSEHFPIQPKEEQDGNLKSEVQEMGPVFSKPFNAKQTESSSKYPEKEPNDNSESGPFFSKPFSARAVKKWSSEMSRQTLAQENSGQASRLCSEDNFEGGKERIYLDKAVQCSGLEGGQSL